MHISAPVRANHLTIARSFAQSPEDWPVQPRYDPVRRWYHRLAATPDLEVWLLTWLPGQATDLHDHGGSAGAFVVVTGELTEHTVAVTPGRMAGDDRARLVPHALPAGTGRWFGSYHVHQLSNTGDQPAVSVHVYGPALRTMTRYRLDSDRLVLAAVDRAGVQW